MHWPIGIVGACVGVLLAGSTHADPSSAGGQGVSLEQRQTAFFAAVTARDADKLALFFAEAAVVHVANMPPIEGRAAIRQFYGNMFRFLTGSIATPEKIDVSESGDLAYGIGRVTNEFDRPEGPVKYTGKYVLVWRRSGGDWMVVLYGVSSNQPTSTP